MDRENIFWGEILRSAGISEPDNDPSAYVKLSSNDEKYENYLHCSHCFIFARTNSTSLGKYERKALVLMQIRFDGRLGFPGGGVDPGETPVQGLNRELREESGWYEKEGPVKEEHHLFSHVHNKRKMVLHFYGIEVSEEKLKEIEENTLRAPDYGGEVLGTCRVPLYTMKKKQFGFPSFLRNNFAGNSRIQLIEALIHFKFISPENVMEAVETLKSSSNISNKTKYVRQ